MKKIKLDLDDLKVESFDTLPGDEGEVFGYCPTFSNENTCASTCPGTCQNTCWETCGCPPTETCPRACPTWGPTCPP